MVCSVWEEQEEEDRRRSRRSRRSRKAGGLRLREKRRERGDARAREECSRLRRGIVHLTYISFIGIRTLCLKIT